ncbi:hypothetical protein [Gemmatimonas sp.]|uniref:hypothetical protein n=1 Tax=Gemmatimonas sp. TaxID=1962908 RepID=UPI0039834564
MYHASARFLTRSLLAATAFFTAGCGDAAPTMVEPESTRAATAAANCAQVLLETTAALGVVEYPTGSYGLGAVPFPATVAGVNGMLGSIVTGVDVSGKLAQGAQHLTLIHFFRSADGSFTTVDRAVCAPAGKDVGTCRVNDVLTVASGTGVFAGATGSFRNTGVINFNTYSLSVSLRGRICSTSL